MKILLDNNVPRLLRNNLPGHQVDIALQFSWHTLSNGELLDQAESEGYQMLITADQRIPYQQNLSRRNIAVLNHHRKSPATRKPRSGRDKRCCQLHAPGRNTNTGNRRILTGRERVQYPHPTQRR